LDLGKYMDKKITVKFNGGREGEFLFFTFSVIFTSCLLDYCDGVGFVRLMCWRCMGGLGSKCNEMERKAAS
jgi:hypothetical protein